MAVPESPAERLVEIARAGCGGPFDRWPVSLAVNNARNNVPELTQPVAA